MQEAEEASLDERLDGLRHEVHSCRPGLVVRDFARHIRLAEEALVKKHQVVKGGRRDLNVARLRVPLEKLAPQSALLTAA